MSPSTPEDRLRRIAPLAGLDASRAEPVLSHSNDAWFVDDVVLRVCWRGDRRRLLREATVVSHLPDGLPHAPVLDFGTDPDGELTWMTTRRLRGEILRDLWDDFDGSQRGRAATQIGEALASLHHWTPPTAVLEALADDLAVDAPVEDVTGRVLLPLPVSRVKRLVSALAPAVPAKILDVVASRLDELAAFDPFAAENTTVTHGDAHLRNALWQDGRLVALLDFEWARLGPADLDLEPFLRSKYPAFDEVAPFLRVAHPDLFTHPNLASRLHLYELAFLVRQALVWGASDEMVNQLHAVATRPLGAVR